MTLILEKLTEKIINAAIEVHKSLGPGFLESIYENALCRELNQQGIKFIRQQEIEVRYTFIFKGDEAKGRITTKFWKTNIEYKKNSKLNFRIFSDSVILL